jgi:glucose-1-phosphate thymidylyltransferase
VRKDIVTSGFRGGSKIFLKEIPDAQRFGVAKLDRDRVIGIEEKPEVPRYNFAVTGLYMYDPEVFKVIRTLKPSGRGEFEITDVNNEYISRGVMGLDRVFPRCGNIWSLLRASVMVQKYREKKEGTANIFTS